MTNDAWTTPLLPHFRSLPERMRAIPAEYEPVRSIFRFNGVILPVCHFVLCLTGGAQLAALTGLSATSSAALPGALLLAAALLLWLQHDARTRAGAWRTRNERTHPLPRIMRACAPAILTGVALMLISEALPEALNLTATMVAINLVTWGCLHALGLMLPARPPARRRVTRAAPSLV